MPRELQNITHRAGDKRVIIFGPVIDLHGHYVDLSSSNAVWRLAKSPWSTGDDIMVSKDTSSSGGIEITREDKYGVWAYSVEVTLDPADTADLPPCRAPNKWFHACETLDATAQPSTIAEGFFDLRPSILNQSVT